MIQTLTLPTSAGMADRYVVSTGDLGVTIEHDMVDERGICEPASTATLYIVPEALIATPCGRLKVAVIADVPLLKPAVPVPATVTTEPVELTSRMMLLPESAT